MMNSSGLPDANGSWTIRQIYSFEPFPGAKTVEVSFGLSQSIPFGARAGGPPPEKVWTLTGLPVPQLGQNIVTNLATNILGSAVQLTEISVSQAPLRPARPPQLDLVFEARSDQQLFIVDLEDDLGRSWPLVGSGTTSYGSGTSNTAQVIQRTFQFTPLDGASALNVTLGVARSETFEFCVKPVLAASAASAKGKATNAPARR